MVGMIQILIYLFSIYLIYKGFEIFQLALTSARNDRTAALVIGVLAIIIAFGAAGLFVEMGDRQASSISTSMSR